MTFDKFMAKFFFDKENETGTGEPVETPPAEPTPEISSITEGKENAPEPVEVATEEEAGFNIEDLISDEDVIDEPPTPDEPKEPVAEEPPAEPQAETEPTPKKPETEAPKEPDQPAEPEPQAQTPDEPQPQTQEEPEPQVSREALQQQYTEFFNKSVETLAEKVYAFDEETCESLDTEPSKVLPKLAATLHMQVMAATTSQIAQMLPTMMTVMNERSQSQQEVEDRFYGEYPELKGHQKEVMQIAAAYRQMNPQALYKDLAPQVAATAKVQLKLFDTPPTTQQPPAPPKPVTPTAAAGGSTPPAAPAQPTEWEELIKEE